MKENIDIWRDKNGIPHVEADNLRDLYWGQGYVHGIDRGLQLLLMRILGQGRVCELLDDSDASLAIDIFFRKMNWCGHVKDAARSLPENTQKLVASYAQGVSTALSQKAPWELKLLGYKPEPWRMEDVITLSRMVGYLTLSQSQAEIERLLMEMIQADVSMEHLEELFPGHLGDLDRDLLKKVSIQERLVPLDVLWQTAAPRMMASNNWVISGTKTSSGKPILSNDPHLEVNRLPNIWCETVLKVKDRFALGATMPGFPGILIGRTKNVAWGATYAFIDAIDSWVEKCKDGHYYRQENDQWIPFSQRREIILRKKNPSHKIVFFENDHGVLDGDPETEGYYLTTRWSADRSGAVSMDRILHMWHVDTVQEAMDTLGRQESAWSFVFADTRGDIGFQMSGLAPIRREGVSGLIPLPGWDKANDWQGFVHHQDLPRVFNPEQGFFATANHDLNAFGKMAPINMPMGSYRADRINDLLDQRDDFRIDDMFEMHFDLFSRQAQTYMSLLKPMLPDTEQGRLLMEWDCCYDRESQGAYLFEAFYHSLISETFGKHGFGRDVCQYLSDETGVFIDFYQNFDRILLSETSVWFGGETRDSLYERVAQKALDIPARPWGESRRFMMRHLVFGGKLPAFLGFDRGPITGIGGRATIHQGQIYRSDHRETTFFPSYRIVSDLSGNECRSNMAGGPSDRRFSKWYVSDLDNWKKGQYKTLSLHDNGKRRPFK
jgi:penicillin G amidase